MKTARVKLLNFLGSACSCSCSRVCREESDQADHASTVPPAEPHPAQHRAELPAPSRGPSTEQGQLTWPWQWFWPHHPSRRSLVRPALLQPSPRLVQKGQPRPTAALPWHCSSSAAAKQPAELACEAAASSPGCCMRCRPRQQPPAQGCSTRHRLRPSGAREPRVPGSLQTGREVLRGTGLPLLEPRMCGSVHGVLAEDMVSGAKMQISIQQKVIPVFPSPISSRPLPCSNILLQTSFFSLRIWQEAISPW